MQVNEFGHPLKEVSGLLRLVVCPNMGLWNGECSNVPWRWHTWESLRKAVFPMMLSFSCLAARLPSAYTAPFWAIFSQGYRAFCAKKKVTSKRAELDLCPRARPLCGAYTLNSGWGMQRALSVFFSPWVTWDGLQGGRRDSHRISGRHLGCFARLCPRSRWDRTVARWCIFWALTQRNPSIVTSYDLFC